MTVGDGKNLKNFGRRKGLGKHVCGLIEELSHLLTHQSLQPPYCLHTVFITILNIELHCGLYI